MAATRFSTAAASSSRATAAPARWLRGLTPAQGGATLTASGNEAPRQPAFGNSPRPLQSSASASAAVTAAARPNAAIPATRGSMPARDGGGGVEPARRRRRDAAQDAATAHAEQLPVPRAGWHVPGHEILNAGGLDPAGFIESRRATGGEPLPGVGDDAVITRRGGITQVTFVIGTASVELLVSGIPQARADSAMHSLAVQAAARMTSPSAAYDMGGTNRFVGASAR